VGNLDEMMQLVARYTSAAWIGMAAVAALLGVRALVRRRSGREKTR
jgi:hypothetical protein